MRMIRLIAAAIVAAAVIQPVAGAWLGGGLKPADYVLSDQNAGGGQTPRFRSATDHVTTEVIVRDSRGVFVPDLTVKDFSLFEDGVRQTLTTFVRVIGGRPMNLTPEPPARREGLILPPVKGQEPGRVFAIFIDDRHIQPGDSLPARRLMGQIRDILLHDGDLLTMVSTGPSSIEEPLNYDIGHARIDRVTARILANGMTPEEIIATNQTSQGPAGLRHDAHVAFRTAYDLLEQLAKIPDRRKAFLYVSSGYDFNPYVNARFKAVQDSYLTSNGSGLSRADVNRFRNPLESGGQQFSEMDLIAELAALSHSAQRANVTFYTMDPRGLTAGPPINSNLSAEEYRRQVNTSVSSLKLLGEESVGFFICYNNVFTRGLKLIDNAMSDYYLIGYTSSNADQNKVRRTISVQVRRPGVTVSGYRKEYLIKR
jgi:VWFA-related protein